LHGRAIGGWSVCSSSSLLGGVAHTARRLLTVRAPASGTVRLVELLPGMLSPEAPSPTILQVGVSAVAGLGMKELRGVWWPFGLARIRCTSGRAGVHNRCTHVLAKMELKNVAARSSFAPGSLLCGRGWSAFPFLTLSLSSWACSPRIFSLFSPM